MHGYSTVMWTSSATNLLTETSGSTKVSFARVFCIYVLSLRKYFFSLTTLLTFFCCCMQNELKHMVMVSGNWQLSPQECDRKWCNLLQTYCHIKTKLGRSGAAGSQMWDSVFRKITQPEQIILVYSTSMYTYYHTKFFSSKIWHTFCSMMK